MSLRSVGAGPLPSLNAAAYRLLERLYWGILLPQMPITEKHISKDERSQQICSRYALGDRLEAIGDDYGVSVQRISQLIRRWCK
jgi:hypothetical protein